MNILKIKSRQKSTLLLKLLNREHEAALEWIPALDSCYLALLMPSR